jgi:uncharacterized membrane protein YhiD involved in acid resistance
MTRLRAIGFAVVLGAALLATIARAQPVPGAPGTTLGSDQDASRREALPPDRSAQFEQLRYALQRLPIAAGLAALLALRPRRKGTPARQAPVIQTQIILAIVGAVVMLVVGTSLARAFGIVGAAGLVRYRAKIEDPKDAGVMLSTLAIGLASGVGLWMLAVFSTLFVLGILWLVESFEPQAYQLFTLDVKAKDPASFRPKLESLLARHRLEFDLRASTPEEITYAVRVPLDKPIERLSNGILKLDPANVTAVEWDDKKEKKK